ncbi:hypothetical protein TIFTF001_020298 [Ficus carica]|uniref:Uncharacterized protein n=1 Tax=Ficus carica TaxID=3494 RepID=A0AA88ADF1_FICCA|nr:hypothetical protein TIFTF001_020298 [Ficus carica]
MDKNKAQGGNLQLYPEEKQHYVGHNKRGKYNSAYSIGFVVYTCLMSRFIVVVLAERKLTVLRPCSEAVKKFEQLARLCPHLISSERDKVRRMMRMFRSDLAVDKTRSNRLSFSWRKEKKRPKLSRTRPSKAKPHNRRVKEDLRVKTTTTSSTATTNRRGSGMQEDRGIHRIFPRKRMSLITTVIPLVRNVGEGTREIAVLETVAVFYVARKATMLKTAISIPRVRRTNRDDRDLNFMQHR